MHPRPNIVLILCDQLRGDAIGADGNPHIQTPHIDALAARGTRFACAYSAVPSCIPARAILWSGQDQWHTGVTGMGSGQRPMPNDFAHTLAGELSAAGYRTHLVGKGHFHPHRAAMGFQTMELDESGRMPDSDYRTWFADNAPPGVTPDDHGIDWNSWHAGPWHTAEQLHPTHWTMTRSLAFLEQAAGAQPFFLNISFAHPHSPYVPPARWFNTYINTRLPDPCLGAWSQIHDDPEGIRDPNAWQGRMSPEQIQRARAGYNGCVSFIDEQIGRLLDTLGKDPATLDRTWFLLAADHGDMLGDHHLWRKTYAYEGSSRVPFLVVPPTTSGIPCRRQAMEVVELRDIMPTLLAAAGCPCPDSVDGRSVLPLLDAPASDWRTHIHGEHQPGYVPEEAMHFVTDGARKFIWFPQTGREQFFDLEKDPGETRNLIDDRVSEDAIRTWRGRLAREIHHRSGIRIRSDQPLGPAKLPDSPFGAIRWTGSGTQSKLP